MKRALSALALMAALVPIAAAQASSRLPEASLDRELDLEVPAHSMSAANSTHSAPGPPSYCKPCLFYAGDWDSNASDANGIANEVDLIVSTGAAIYVPFRVPTGKTWTVTGLFNDTFLNGGDVLDPARSPYEIRKDIPAAGGSGGKLVCRGRLSSTAKPAGIIGFSIYAVMVRGIRGCTLKGGIKYWMSVIPYCTNPLDNACANGWRAFVTNDDGAMAHRFGALEPANNSFFNSVFFGASWEPSSKQQSSARFSVGVEGKAK